MKRLIFLLLLGADTLAAIQHSGSVRAADQFIPGATVTARQGGATLITATDEAGLYKLDLTPGIWEVQIEIFGFKPAAQKVEISSSAPSNTDWTLEMPRPGEIAAPVNGDAKFNETRRLESQRQTGSPAPAQVTGETPTPVPVTSPIPNPVALAAPAARAARALTPVRQAVKSLAIKSTAAGKKDLEETAAAAPPPEPEAAETDSFVVSGSTSGGLTAAAEEQARVEKRPAKSGQAAGGIAEMAAMSAGGSLASDPMGMNGFGLAGIQGGFSDGPGGGAGAGGGKGGAGRAGAGGGGGRGAAANGGRKAGKQAKRGAVASFATIGNKRKDRPTYTGSVALTGRNSVLDAKPFSLNGQEAPKSSYAQETLAVNLGGPIRIPKIYSNERLMFSFNYQGARARNPFNSLTTMPTAAERGGDFSQAVVSKGPVTIYDPLTASPFPGNVIPVNRIDPTAAGLLRFFPLPTYPQLTVQNYRVVTSSRANSDTYGFRQNLPLTRKDRVNVSFNYQTRTGTTPTALGFHDAADGSGMNGSFGYSHSFAPRFNSNFTWNFSRSTGYNLPFFAYSDNIAAQLGIAGTTQEPIAYGPPNLSFTNFGTFSDGSASISRNQTSDLNDAITLVRKKHNLTFGIGYRRLQQNPMNYANARGSFSFSGLLTSGFDSKGSPLAQTGFDFADFLLGFPQSSSLQFGAKSNYFRSWSINGFAQDDFRFSPNLSINLGLRYEYFSPYTELFGRMANLDLNSTITAASIVTPGQPGPYSGELPTSLVRSDSNNYSPRFGFAWKPNAKKALTIRGGYSIFFNGSAYGTFSAKMASQPPFVRTASLSTSAANRLTLQNGFAAAPSQTITNNYAIDPNYRLGYAQTWTFALQQSLPHNLIAELEYIGTKGTALDILRQPNRATPGSPFTAAQRLQIGNATGFTLETAQGSSIMHMGQLRITRRLVRGISTTATYAFQKSLDNASSFGGGGGAVAQNDQNLRLERGLSTFDQRHVLNMQYVLSSPVGGARGLLRSRGWSKRLLEDWTLTGGFVATSGTPLTARVSGNLVNTGGTAAFGSGRAQATGLPINGDGTYFNLAAFTTPPGGQYGNAGRNTIPGLFRTTLNASFGRAFRIAESRRNLAVRLNTTNTLNHVVITNIGTTVNAATYGLPISASPTRTVNLTLRFTF